MNRAWFSWCFFFTLTLSAQTVNFEVVGTIPGPADLIEVQGNRAYVSANKTLTILDVSSPSSVKSLGAYSFPFRIWGFRVAGSTIYVAADLFGLGILDVSNAAAPTLRASLKTPGQAKNVAFSGTTVLVADHTSGIDIVDVSNPTKPVLTGSVFLDGFALDVVTAGRFAFAVDRPTGFYVLDLSKPDLSEPINALQSGVPTFGIPPAQLEVTQRSKEGRMFAVFVAPGALQLYDVSNPSTPLALSPFQMAGVPQRVFVQGSLAYVAAGPAGIQVVYLTIPSKPSIVGVYKTPIPAIDVAVTEGLIFVATRGGDVAILRRDK